MFEWQAACLQTGKVLTGGELGRFYFYKWKLIEGEAVPKEKVPLFYTFYFKKGTPFTYLVLIEHCVKFLLSTLNALSFKYEYGQLFVNGHLSVRQVYA